MVAGRAQKGCLMVAGRSQKGFVIVAGRSQKGCLMVAGRSQKGCIMVAGRPKRVVRRSFHKAISLCCGNVAGSLHNYLVVTSLHNIIMTKM